MKRKKIFEIDKSNGLFKTTYCLEYKESKRIVTIKFSICPTQTTKELFKMLLDNYKIETDYSYILPEYREEHLDSVLYDMNIINSMTMSFYDPSICPDSKFPDGNLIFPVISRVLFVDGGINIYFYKDFKKLFDKNFRM